MQCHLPCVSRKSAAPARPSCWRQKLSVMGSLVIVRLLEDHTRKL